MFSEVAGHARCCPFSRAPSRVGAGAARGALRPTAPSTPVVPFDILIIRCMYLSQRGTALICQLEEACIFGCCEFVKCNSVLKLEQPLLLCLLVERSEGWERCVGETQPTTLSPVRGSICVPVPLIDLTRLPCAAGRLLYWGAQGLKRNLQKVVTLLHASFHSPGTFLTAWSLTGSKETSQLPSSNPAPRALEARATDLDLR